APSFANFGIEGHWQFIDLVWLWFRSPHFGLAARIMRTSEPPHWHDANPCSGETESKNMAARSQVLDAANSTLRKLRPVACGCLHLRASRATFRLPMRNSGTREAAMKDVPTKTTSGPFKWVGTRPVRPDGVPKVTGRALYGADLAMPGMLVGRILRSPHAHARIRSIDTSQAAGLPGVKAVVTSADFPEQKFEYVGPERVAQNFWHMTRNI